MASLKSSFGKTIASVHVELVQVLTSSVDKFVNHKDVIRIRLAMQF